jgi:hypothetical protein
MNQSYATLDLSAASDRLSLDLVEEFFENTVLYDYITKTRTSKAILPNGTCIPLNKFAPMGSALCFPIQAICFYAIIVGRFIALGMDKSFAYRNVWVYGDDIIVPTNLAFEAIEALELVGLKVNVEKSCISGKFRESCGVDAYNGVNVTPTKIKEIYKKGLSIESITAWVAYSNNLYAMGYWRAAYHIRDMIRKQENIIPLSSNSTSPVVSFFTYVKTHVEEYIHRFCRYSATLHTYMIKGVRPASRSFSRLIHLGWEGLLCITWNQFDSEFQALDLLMHGKCKGIEFTDRHAVTKKHVLVDCNLLRARASAL